MNRELQNMSEESLQNLEEIVETELLTVEDIRNRLDVTEKGKIRQSIQNCKYALEHDPCLKGAICRNEMTCQIDIMKKMPWKRRGVHMTDTDMNLSLIHIFSVLAVKELPDEEVTVKEDGKSAEEMCIRDRYSDVQNHFLVPEIYQGIAC